MQLFFQPASGYDHVTLLYKPRGHKPICSLIIGRTKKQLRKPTDVCHPCPKDHLPTRKHFGVRKIPPGCVIKDLYQYLPSRPCDNPTEFGRVYLAEQLIIH